MPVKRLAARLYESWFSPPEAVPLPLMARWLLVLLERIYLGMLWLREAFYLRFLPAQRLAQVRVIALGNLVLGGAGKTPAALALAEACRQREVAVGFVLRGYQSAAERGPPRLVLPHNLMNIQPSEIGDESWLIAWRTQRPVAVGRNRYEAARRLLEACPELTTLVLDDGLQQRSLAWDEGILILDERGLGNGHCIPRGPLREPAVSLERFTAWIDNGALGQGRASGLRLPKFQGELVHEAGAWIPLSAWRDGGQWLSPRQALERFKGCSILAVAGIAVPERFFDGLTALGLGFDRLSARDHDPELVSKTLAAFQKKSYDLVLMTEKDAVKFFHQQTPLHAHAWALRRDTRLDESFLERLFDGHQAA